MKKILPGGSGFVGRNLMPHFLKHGDEVVALSRSETSDKNISDAAVGASGSVNIFRGDVNMDTAAMAQGAWLRGCSAAWHGCMARSHAANII